VSKAATQAAQAPAHPSSAAQGGLRRKCACGNHTLAGAECAECGKQKLRLQRKADRQSNKRGPYADAEPEDPALDATALRAVLAGPGRPMDAPLRGFMETRFGHDFSGVRLHTDAQAAASAKAVGALAYTVGRDIVFDSAGYAPHTPQGLQLVAHELTHVMQHERCPLPAHGSLQVEAEDSPAEREAERMATMILSPGPVVGRPAARAAGLGRATGWAILGGVIGAIVGGLLGALAGPVGAAIGAFAGAALGTWFGAAGSNSKSDDKQGTARQRIHRLLSRDAGDWVVTDEEAIQALGILQEVEKKDPVELFDIVMMMKLSGEWDTLREELPSVMRPGLEYFEISALHPDRGYIMPGDRIHLEFYFPGQPRFSKDQLAAMQKEGKPHHAGFEESISLDYDVDSTGVRIPRMDETIPIVGKSLKAAADRIAQAFTDPLWAYEMGVDLRPVKRGIKYAGMGEVSSPETVQGGAITGNKEALAQRDKRRRFTDLVPFSLATAGGRLEMAVLLYYQEVDGHLEKHEDPEALWQWAQAQADKRWEELNKKTPAQEFLSFGQERMAHASTLPPDEQQRTRETYSRYMAWLSKHSEDPKLATFKPMDIWVRAYLNIVTEEVEKSTRKAMDALKEKRRDAAWKKAEIKFGEVMDFAQARIWPSQPTRGITSSEETISEETGEIVKKGWLISASPAEKIIRDKIASDFLHSVLERMQKDPEAFIKTSVKSDFLDYLRDNPEQYQALALTMAHPDVERVDEKVDIPAWQTATEVVVGLIPFVGTGVAIAEVVGGRDLFGHPLTTTERTIIGVAILLPGIAKAAKLGKGAFVASRIAKEYSLEGAEAARVYRIYTGLAPGSPGAKLFGWGANEIKAGRAIDDPKVLREMEKILKDLGMAEKDTAKALLPAVERQAEAVAKEEVRAVEAVVGPISKDTEEMLMKNPSLREALKENSLAATVLKKCNTPCIPEGATAQQVKKLEGLLERLKKVDAYDEEALRRFLYERRAELDKAIKEVGAMADLAEETAKAKPKPGAAAAEGGSKAKPTVRKGPLDVSEQVKAAKKLQSVEEQIAERTASIRKENEAARSARQQLKTLAESPKSVPDGIKSQMERINKLKGLEERVEAIDELLTTSKGLSEPERSFLEWRKKTWSLQHEAESAEETSRYLAQRMGDLTTAKEVAAAELREASKDLIDVMRSNGPNYSSKGNVNVDEVMSPEAWKALPQPRPALATDHLVALDRISKMPELNELLMLYSEASPALKTKIKADLKGLGDIQENLVRMRGDFNSGVKSNKSWGDLTYDQAKRFGYGAADVDKMRGREGKALSTIKQKIADLTAQYKAEVKASAPR